MVICSLDALKKSSKKKETRIKKEIVEVNNTDFNFIFCYYLLHYASCELFEK